MRTCEALHLHWPTTHSSLVLLQAYRLSFCMQTSYRCSYFSHPLLFVLRCSCIWDKCEQRYHSYSFLPLKATLKLFGAFSPFHATKVLAGQRTRQMTMELAYLITQLRLQLLVIGLERFSNDCRKNKNKAITPTNHNRNKQHDEPITIPSNYLKLARSAGEVTRTWRDWFWFCFSLAEKLVWLF